MPSTTVGMKSAWASKINWTQAVAFAAMMFSSFGIDLDAETQAAVVSGIAGIQAAVTWVLRTWYTTDVTPSSVGK